MDTLVSPTTSSTVSGAKTRHPWRDEATGRTVIQLTDVPGGVGLGYFRNAKHLPDGRLLAFACKTAQAWLIDPEGRTPETVDFSRAAPKRDKGIGSFSLQRGTTTCLSRGGRDLWQLELQNGELEKLASLPADLPGTIYDIACDGETVLVLESEQDTTLHPIPTTMDITAFWHFFERPRRGAIHAWNWRTGTVTTAHEIDGVCPLHVEGSPVDPGLIRFCHDMYDAFGQRIWTVRTDGTHLRPIRPQEYGELVTHEFWAMGGSLIGYTYQDRRADPTVREKPWAEYSPTTTHFGLADLAGREIYCSKALNCYHTHLYLSEDGSVISGEGTDGHSSVYAAPFSPSEKTIDFRAMATVHTPYVPFRGQNVECAISADNRWLLYNDSIDGHFQVCAVALEL